jgi:oligopeptide transport system substrate-binding protein
LNTAPAAWFRQSAIDFQPSRSTGTMQRAFSPRNIFALIVGLLVLAAVAYSLSFGTLPPADFTFLNGTEIKTVDPQMANGVPEGRIIRELFEGLCAWHPTDLHPIPGVAQSWDISDDKKTYSFHLRDNAVWTDGTPVTAEDFVYSWRRLLHPATASEYSYEGWYLVNAERFTKQQFQVGDRVEIELVKTSEDRDPARPSAPGKIVRGELLAIETAPGKPAAPADINQSPDELHYIVEIDGRRRRFQKGAVEGRDEGEDYAWLLIDFETVGVKAIDPRTLEVKLRHPVPYFLDLMGFYPFAPVNRRCVESHLNQEWTRPENIVSNGPFELHTRRVRDRIRLVKSDTYWDRDNVRLNVVDALAVESLTTGLNLYLTNQVEWLEYVPNSVVRDLIAQKRPDFQPSPFITTYYYRLNVTRPPLDNVLVRRALNLATNKRDIVERVTMAGQQPARSMVPPVVGERTGYVSPQCEDFDPEQARALLAEAGYPGGAGMPSITIQFNTNDTHKQVAELIQYQWKTNLGIDVELRGMEWNAYQAAQVTLQYDVSRAGWVGDYPDPNTFLNLWITGGGNNQTGWGSPRYDELIGKAQDEPDEKQRLRYFYEAETILLDEMPVIPVYFYVSTSMAKPYLRGYHKNARDVHPLKDLWIDEEAKAEYLRKSE